MTDPRLVMESVGRVLDAVRGELSDGERASIDATLAALKRAFEAALKRQPTLYGDVGLLHRALGEGAKDLPAPAHAMVAPLLSLVKLWLLSLE